MKTVTCFTLCPDLCMGKVCPQIEWKLGDWTRREITLKSVSDSQLHFLGATLAQARPTYLLLVSFLLVAETLYLVFITPGWCDGYTVPHKGTKQMFMRILALLTWMSVIVVCICNYKILFLFNVTDYGFFKSVFFHVTLLPYILITCPSSLIPR